MPNTLPETYPLIDAHELQALLGQGNATPVHVLDCRFELANPLKGQADFDAGHIPGARYVHIDHDLCGEKTGQNGRHPLPDFFEFVLRTQQWGLKKDDVIIAMDANNALVAGRLWWMLRWAGYPKAKVLNGGWDAWLKSGGRCQQSAMAATQAAPITKPAPAHFTANANTQTPVQQQPSMATVDVNAVIENIGNGAFLLIDGRDRERFTGQRDTMDPVAGHIPGARNRCFTDNLNTDGTFKSPDKLRAEFAPLLQGRPAGAIVHSCGSGVTACNNLLAMEAAGLAGSRLYPGSWSEYCADPSRPVERGD